MSWGRWAARILLAFYSALLAIALFSPSSEHQSSAVAHLGSLLTSLGAPSRLVTYPRLEVVMNAAIVAPVTFLGSLSFPSWSWRDWTAAGFLVAVGVELAQGLLLPGRQATFSDIVANTMGAFAGALVGALVVTLVRPMLRTRTAR
jgi:glycopeptide antibiotics resistance protein